MLQSACYLFSEFIAILVPSPRFKYITHRCPIPAQNLKLLLLTCWISSMTSGWILMLFTDILHIALGQEQKAICGGDKNHKKVFSSQGAGVKALRIFFGCIHRHTPDLIKKFSILNFFFFKEIPEPWKLTFVSYLIHEFLKNLLYAI